MIYRLDYRKGVFSGNIVGNAGTTGSILTNCRGALWIDWLVFLTSVPSGALATSASVKDWVQMTEDSSAIGGAFSAANSELGGLRTSNQSKFDAFGTLNDGRWLTQFYESALQAGGLIIKPLPFYKCGIEIKKDTGVQTLGARVDAAVWYGTR